MIIPPQAYLIGGALALAAAGGVGYKVRDWQCDAQIAAIQAEIDKAAQEARGQANEASQGFETDRAGIEQSAVNTRTIIERTYREVPSPSTSVDCTVPEPVLDSLRAARDLANRSATGELDGTLPDTP